MSSNNQIRNDDTTTFFRNDAIDDTVSDHMVVMQADRSAREVVTKHRFAPICMSKRDGRIIHAFGRTIWSGPTNFGSSYIPNPNIVAEDISTIMTRRARCTNEVNYSMNSQANIELLRAEEICDLENNNSRNQLIQLWMWIERIECFISEKTRDDNRDESTTLSTFGSLSWSSRTLIDSGAWRLLRFHKSSEPEVQCRSDSLQCTTYESDGRRAVLDCCGWAGKNDLGNVARECVDRGEYERAAALAVWHGDIGLAVVSLQQGADYIRSKQSATPTSSSEHSYTNTEYVQLLELVSLAIAGYHGGHKESATSQVWQKSTLNILQRHELQDNNNMSSRAVYIRHMLKFLLKMGDDDLHKDLLHDSTLSLTDRIAFACRFVSRINLKLILEKFKMECILTGDVEGIVITGLGRDGISILQTYVDQSADIQSVAIITSRVVLPPDWNAERRVIAEWLHTYRMLLNSLHMWRSRAIFDVDRAQLLRKVKQRTSDAAIQSIGRSGSSLMVSGRRQIPNKRNTRFNEQDVQASVPTQLEARCNYCNTSLSLRKQDNQPNLWLSKMKNVLSCCPNCRKPLPRCSICMLPLGALNPYMELVRNSQSSSKHGGVDDLSQLASVPIAEWFTWCVRCKHGGHANHLVGWFAKHDICPVSGCSCNCQFDATCTTR